MDLVAFVHAEQQLQAQGDACVPPQGKDADVAGDNRRPQQVLHRRGAVRVSIEHLRKEADMADMTRFRRGQQEIL